ncbi:DUF3219 family protein [Paenibacillus sp. WLX1005]|uniref:DUF3219 family protein n=1 Tax=unclassified Paenibacillus TaxID=185978 RepID=UPI003983DE8A
MSTSDVSTLIHIADLQIEGLNYREDQLNDADGGTGRTLIVFDFVITGQQEYHDVTSTLYESVINVQVPGRQLAFQATVHSYFTSVPKLENEEDTVDVHLELLQVAPSVKI